MSVEGILISSLDTFTGTPSNTDYLAIDNGTATKKINTKGLLVDANIAPVYSTSATYAVGDYVYYNGDLYRCTTAITTAEAWTSGHWTKVVLANDVSDLKDDYTNSFNYLFGDNSVSFQSGTLDSSGIYGSSSRSIVSNFIPIKGKKLYIIVPTDGSISYRTYFYSGNTENTFGVRGTVKTASNVATNSNYGYVRVLAYYTQSGKNSDSNLYKSIRVLTNYCDALRGDISLLGVSSFGACTKEGYYGFKLQDLENLSDAPNELKSGGILKVYERFGSFTLYQEIVATDGDQYFRYGSQPFKRMNASETNSLIISPMWEIGAITSSTGENASSTKRVRSANSIEIKGGFSVEIPSGMQAEIIAYDANNSRVSSTGFLTKSTVYYPHYGEKYFRIYGGYIDNTVISDATVGDLFVLKYIDNLNRPVWLALGDSITQGFYSYNDGTDHIKVTLDCWASITAQEANLRLINSGVGGSGYVHNGTVLDQLNAKDHVDTLDFTDIDFVTLAYGLNDWKYNENLGTMDSTVGDGTIYGNMRCVIEKIISENPLCKIFIVTPLNSANTTKDYGTEETNWGLGYSLSNSGTLEQVYQAEKDVADYYGIQLIDQTHSSIVNRKNLLSVLIDGVHPSYECHSVIGKEMAKKITFA